MQLVGRTNALMAATCVSSTSNPQSPAQGGGGVGSVEGWRCGGVEVSWRSRAPVGGVCDGVRARSRLAASAATHRQTVLFSTIILEVNPTILEA